jgi:hypothetical protein
MEGLDVTELDVEVIYLGDISLEQVLELLLDIRDQ